MPFFAVADEDYLSRPTNFTLSDTNLSGCFNVTILNDDTYELEEEFLVNLTTTDQAIIFAHLVIVIIDEDSE